MLRMHYNYNYLLVNLTWTEKEKEQLLTALQKYGVKDIAKLATEIPTKSVNEIRIAIGLYERVAILSLKPEKEEGEVSKAPIDGWLEYLKRVAPESCNATRDVATSLKFIAMFEEHTDNKDVVLSDCYEYLSDLSTGKAPKKLDDATMHFFMTCFAKFGMRFKEEDVTKEKEFIKNLVTANVVQKTYTNKNASAVSNPNINVLKIPLHLARMNKDI